MFEEGRFIYSIISEGEQRKFEFSGINNREIKCIYHKDLAAVVSKSPMINFRRLDKQTLAEYKTEYEKTNLSLLKDFDVVPVLFGAVLRSDAEVQNILEQNYHQLKTALEKIGDKGEFAAQVYWNKNKLIEELINTSPEIQILQKKSLKGGIWNVPAKLKFKKIIQQELDNYKQSYIRNIQTFIGEIASEFVLNQSIKNDIGDMIANFSFLIEKANQCGFEQKILELKNKYKDKLRFKSFGPVPPYSFVNIDLKLKNN